MTSKAQKMIPAHDTDPKASTARLLIARQKATCLHCGEPLHLGSFITYTELSNNKIIWWHQSHVIDDFDDLAQ